MDLTSLHSLMIRKKYHYFTGNTNEINNDLWFDFTQLSGGRGNSVDIRIGMKNHDIITRVNNTGTIMHSEITTNNLFKILEKL